MFSGHNGLVSVCINSIPNSKFFLKCYCPLNLQNVFTFYYIEWYTCMTVIIKFLFEGCIFSKKWFKSVCAREAPCYWRSSRDGGDRTRSIYTLSWLNFNFKIIWFWEASKYKSFVTQHCMNILFQIFILFSYSY